MAVVAVKQTEEEVPVEILAQAIADIGAAMRKINESRLTRPALIVLLSHSSKKPMYVVEQVLDALDSLERTYLKPKRKP